VYLQFGSMVDEGLLTLRPTGTTHKSLTLIGSSTDIRINRDTVIALRRRDSHQGFGSDIEVKQGGTTIMIVLVHNICCLAKAFFVTRRYLQLSILEI